MSKKKILYLSNSYPATVSGVSTVVRNLLQWMVNEYEVGIICPNATTRYAEKKQNGITHYFLPSYPTVIRKDVRFITPNPILIQKAFNSFSPNIVHMHDPSPASSILRDIAISNDRPVIFSHHFTTQMVLGYLPENIKTLAQNNTGLNKAILQITCRIYDGAKVIIVPSQTVANSLNKMTNIPIQIISSGVDCDAFNKVTSQMVARTKTRYQIPNSPFILYVGRLDPEKNLSVLLSAFSLIAVKIKDIQLVIAGSGSEEMKLRKYAIDLRIADRIRWIGVVQNTHLSALYKNPYARAFVITSASESQSIATLTALAAGLPIVAANAGALPELVQDGISGYLCTHDNAMQFANKISEVLDNPQHSHVMSQTGSKIASEHDYSKIIRSYKDLYDKFSNN